MSYIITTDSLIIHQDGKTHTLSSTHQSFEKVKNLIKSKDFDAAIQEIDIANKINTFGQGKISVVGGVIFYGDKALHNVICTKILDMIAEGFDVNPMLKFLENLMENPSRTAIDELYLFLESGKLPITEDGYFLAYKKVKTDYKDYHSGKFDHTPGSVLQMNRNEVDDNRDRTCSYGFHFCSLAYLPHYYGGEGKVVILKINPKDVVSIPSDYNNTKGRACYYTVLEEYTGPETEHAFDKSVWFDPSFVDEEDELDSDNDSFDGDSWDEENLNSETDDNSFEEFSDLKNELDKLEENQDMVDDADLKKSPIPKKISEIFGTKWKRNKKKYQVVSIVGQSRDNKGRFINGGWILKVMDLKTNKIKEMFYNDIINDKRID